MIPRKKPLPRKRARRRAWKSPRCLSRGCKRPQAVKWKESLAKSGEIRFITGPLGGRTGTVISQVFGMCLTHAKREADRRFSLAVRSIGRCECCGATEGLQCSHFVSRRYLGVRYVRLNAECLCFRCHKFFTERPLEAQERAVDVLGSEPYAELRRFALAFHGPLDYAAVLASYPRSVAEVTEP